MVLEFNGLFNLIDFFVICFYFSGKSNVICIVSFFFYCFIWFIVGYIVEGEGKIFVDIMWKFCIDFVYSKLYY